MERIVIERLGKKKQILERWTLKELPVTIGRGYENDVIVSDPYVAEKQLIVTGEGDRWQIENIDPVNAIFVNNVIQEAQSFEIQSGDKVVIGETTLRLVSSTHKVAATKKLIKKKAYLTNSQRIIFAWASVVLALACFSLVEFLDTSKATSWVKILARPYVLPLAALPIAWAIFWASMGRTLIQTPNFYRHLLISTLIAIAGRCTLILSEYIKYGLNSQLAGKMFLYLIAGLLGILLLNTNLKLATTFSKLKRLGIANACVWGAVILFEFFMIARRPEFRGWTSFNSTIKPPYAKILSSKSADEFFTDTDTLFKELDEMIESERIEH